MKINAIFLFLLFIICSCSKTVEFEGKISGASPLDRIEFIEATGVATLPLTNVGISSDGSFQGSFKAPKNGMYLMTYGANKEQLYIKQGQKLNLKIDNNQNKLYFYGDSKNNNEFLNESQKEMISYANSIDINRILQLNQNELVTEFRNVYNQLNESTKSIAKKHNADKEVIEWKLNDIKVAILTILFHYKDQTKVEPNQNFIQFEEKLKANEDQLIEEFPMYRTYLLDDYSDEFAAYFQTEGRGKVDILPSEIFINFIHEKKELSTKAKDYLIAYVMAQRDITQAADQSTLQKLKKLIDQNIHSPAIQVDLDKIILAIGGLPKGEKAPDSPFRYLKNKQKGSINDFKGKPTVLIFYSSWTPNIVQQANELSEWIEFYSDEIKFVTVNFDDTFEQAKKTSQSLFNGWQVTNIYANEGLDSQLAKDYFMYGFKLKPTYIILDKEMKIASPFLFNIKDKRLTEQLDQLSGLEFSGGGVQLQNDLLNTTNEE